MREVAKRQPPPATDAGQMASAEPPPDAGQMAFAAPTATTGPDGHRTPDPFSVAKIRAVCNAICKKATCGGPNASLRILRGNDGTIVRYVHFGDIGTCSHPPATYFDTSAKEVGAIGSFPIVPGSDEEKKIDRKRAGLEAGGKMSEEVDCEGHVTPP